MTFSTAPISDASLAGVNHFHPIRLTAALLVLFAHAFHLLDRGGDEPIGRWFVSLDASLLGVMMFFFISGFLVARSWDVRRSLIDFGLSRGLRIVPALWLALVFTTFVIGPFFTTHALPAYLSDGATWNYLGQNALLRTQYLLPGVFEANPLPGVNGSLWTIRLEAACYAILAVLGWTSVLSGSAQTAGERFRRSPLRFIAMAIIGVVLVAKIAITSPTYSGLALEFLLGALTYRYRKRIGLRPWLAMALLALAVAGPRIGIGAWLMAIAVPYALLTVALHPAFTTRATWLHRHDYSYGAYLYGFPIQQAIIALGIRDPVLLLAIALPAVMAMAAASWHGVERRVLSLKPRSTG